MEVILLEKVHNLGALGDKVNVRPGYGRNFLIPQGKAARASQKNLAEFETRRAELEAKAAQSVKVATDRLAKLVELVVNIPAKASEEGKLFGSVGPREVAEAITQAGVEVQKSEVLMPAGPLRYLGEYDIDVQLHSDVLTTIKVTVVEEK